MPKTTLSVAISSPNEDTLGMIKRAIESINNSVEPVRTVVHAQIEPFGTGPFNASNSLVWGTPILEESATIRVTSDAPQAIAPFMDWLQYVLRILFAHPDWDAISDRKIARGEPATRIALPVGTSK